MLKIGISATVDKEIIDKLDAICDARKWSRATGIAEAIEQYINSPLQDAKCPTLPTLRTSNEESGTT
jgi:predicted transcriptional regulator